MKRKLLTFLMVLASLGCMAQFDAKNSLVRKIIVEYELDAEGFYQKKTGALVDVVDGVESTYAFEKKSGTVYAQTKFGNYMIVLNKEYAKVYKQSKLAPIFDEKLIDAEVDRVTKKITEHFEELNAQRRQHLKDSTERARRDSLEKARQDSIKLAQKRAEEQSYMRSHNWHEIPMSRIGIECVDCGKQVYENTIYSEGISNDTLYFVETVAGVMECSYQKLHAGIISPRLKNNQKFIYHCQIYKDSIYNRPYLSLGYVNAVNKSHYEKYAEEVSVKAPNGYVDWCAHDFQEGSLLFDFTYMNTSNKEIRAIDIYYNIRDAAGNSKKTGKLRGDGPVGVFESHSWSWTTDNKIPVPDSSVDLEITRLVIIYKDGKQKIIAKKDMIVKATEE
jgi:hypothetical protein